MPTSNPVVSAATLAAGIRSNFVQTYDTTTSAFMEFVNALMQTDVMAKARTETEAYFETAPYPEFWNYGTNIPHENTGSVNYEVTMRRYAKRISWNEDDREDDQTRKLVDRAKSLAANFGSRHYRAMFDLINGTTTYLPATVTAPDGAAFFATTAGGANRFGVTSGNLLTGNTVATTANILTDYYAGIAQFILMQDTKGEQLHDPSVIDQGVVVVYGANNSKEFEEAFHQKIIQATAAGVSNVIIDAGRKFKLFPSNKISDDDWYISLAGTNLKPMAQYTRTSLQLNDSTRANSDFVRDTGEEYFQAHCRDGYSINLPYSILKINN